LSSSFNGIGYQAQGSIKYLTILQQASSINLPPTLYVGAKIQTRRKRQKRLFAINPTIPVGCQLVTLLVMQLKLPQPRSNHPRFSSNKKESKRRARITFQEII